LYEELTTNKYKVVGQQKWIRSLDFTNEPTRNFDIDMPLLSGFEVIKIAKKLTNFILQSFHRESEYILGKIFKHRLLLKKIRLMK
jgi:hypothetical protein